jgi:hypothetical protein
LETIEGVADIDVDFQAKTATLTMEPGRALERGACEGAFEGGRYGVVDFREKT